MQGRATFCLNVGAREWVRVYRGEASAVRVRDEQGRWLQIPARLFQRYLTHSGVCGRFVLTCDETGRCLSLQRMATAAEP